ncbi:MAG: AbiEi antitoxin N-terminal domain-containing protein, partial [Natrinema limicola]
MIRSAARSYSSLTRGQKIPKGTVVLASWLVKQGYSHDLQQKYIRSRWLEPVGKGAFKRTGEEVDLFGALYALQSQA